MAFFFGGSGDFMYFCITRVAVILARGHGLPTHCRILLIYLSTMCYDSYDLPSAVTEEGLASMVCASVKDYLGGVTDYVARCQQRVAELEEALGFVTDEKHALQRQVDELKQCLATCHAMRSQAMNFNGVGTVVAHADQVTLQYQAS